MKKIGGVFAFKVKDGPNGQEATWVVDVKNGKGCVHTDICKTPASGLSVAPHQVEMCSFFCGGAQSKKSINVIFNAHAAAFC